MGNNRRVALAAGAISALVLAFLSTNLAMNMWNVIDVNGPQLSAGIQQSPWNISKEKATSDFDVEGDLAFVYVSVHIFLGGNQDLAVTARVFGPEGLVVGPWVVDQNDFCHTGGGCEGKPKTSEVRKEQAILIEPTKGHYVIELTPGPGNDELPTGYHGTGVPSIGPGGVDGYPVRFNAGSLLGTDIWWYYPDGSREYIKDGGYVTFTEGLWRIAGYSILAIASLGGAGYMLWRARRAPGEPS